MKNVLLPVVFVLIAITTFAQQTSESKPLLLSLGQFTMGDNIAAYVNRIKPEQGNIDTSHFGMSYNYMGNDVTAIRNGTPDKVTLKFCSGEMTGVTMGFNELTADKAADFKNQLVGLFGEPDSHTLTEPIKDPSRHKNDVWIWINGKNTVMLTYGEFNGVKFSSIALNNSDLVMKCMTRDRQAASIVKP